MFNNLKRLVLPALILVAIVPGCAREESKTKVKLNQPFEMTIGQTVVATGQDLEIKFEDITEDSRCPKGVVCIWAGQVSVLVEMTAKDGQETLTLTEPGPSGLNISTYRQYRISYQISPYPEAGRAISKGDYKLQLTIKK